jgi:hypothetical protein
LYFIDERIVQRLTQYFTATLDQHTSHILASQIFQHRIQGLPSVNERSLAEPIAK